MHHVYYITLPRYFASRAPNFQGFMHNFRKDLEHFILVIHPSITMDRIISLNRRLFATLCVFYTIVPNHVQLFATHLSDTFAADWQDTLWLDLGEYTLLRCDYSSHADLRSMFWVLPDGRNVSDVPYTNGVRRCGRRSPRMVRNFGHRNTHSALPIN